MSDEVRNQYLNFTVAKPEMKALSKLRQFADFKVGWRFGSGLAFSSEVITAIQQLCNKALESDITRSDLFPGDEGDLTLSLYDGPENHDFTVFPNGQIEYLVESGTKEIDYEPNLCLEEAFTKIFQLGHRKCKSFASYISLISIENKIVSSHKDSVIPRMEAGCLSGERNVLYERQAIFALTPVYSTPL